MWRQKIRLALGALSFAASASAQYSYDIGASDEQGIKYFGAAKDGRGDFLPGVTIVIESGQFSYVLVSDSQGRFKVALPPDTVPKGVQIKCMKVGYQQARLSKRSGPSGGRPVVQVDCELRRQ
jgi:hypothetical protein